MSLAVVAVAAAAVLSPGRPAMPYVSYTTLAHGRARFHVVTADLGSKMVTGGTIHQRRLTPFWQLIQKDQPIAAITGTFFDPRTHRPVADVLVDGALVAKGSRGSGIGVNYLGDVKIFDSPFRSPFDWADYRDGMRGAVRVVSQGVVQPNPKAQAFRDRRIWGRAARTGIGLTSKQKLVLIATTRAITLSELGNAMKKLGVIEGIALDGGGSTMLYYRGSLVIPPKRKLNTLFVLRHSDLAAIPPHAAPR